MSSRSCSSSVTRASFWSATFFAASRSALAFVHWPTASFSAVVSPSVAAPYAFPAAVASAAAPDWPWVLYPIAPPATPAAMPRPASIIAMTLSKAHLKTLASVTMLPPLSQVLRPPIPLLRLVSTVVP